MNITQERISLPDRSYRWLHLEQGAFSGPLHRHPALELTWIQAGVGLRFVGDSVMPFGPGDLVLVGPNLPHAWISDRRRRGRRHECTVLQFPPQLLDVTRWPEMSAAQRLLALGARGLRIDGAPRDAITAVLARMSADGGLRGLALLLELLALLVQHADAMTPLATRALRSTASPRADTDHRVTRVIEWVRSHLAEPLTVPAAAAVAHVSPGAFSRYFAREVGKSFSRYVNDLRCSQACLRLQGSDQPVTLIAQDCGFPTLSNFNRQFRLRTGVTPREFRRGAGA